MLFSVLIIAALMALVAAHSTSHAHTHDHSHEHLEHEHDHSFKVADFTFPSQKEFIAAGKRCGSKQYTEAEAEKVEKAMDAALLKKGIDRNSIVAGLNLQGRADKGFTVPVHIYIVNRDDGTNSFGQLLSPNNLDTQIQRLNAAFGSRRWNFFLHGIDFINSDYLYSNVNMGNAAETQLKSNRIPRSDALNMYLVPMAANGVLGWATFPWDYEQHPNMDGIIIHPSTLPSGSYPYDMGMTTVHEVGHWLGLWHTFQGGCSKNMNGGGDYIKDTPSEAAPYYGCPASENDIPDSCPGKIRGNAGRDPIFNMMDYADDRCMSEVTTGQFDRIHHAWKAFRETTLPPMSPPMP